MSIPNRLFQGVNSATSVGFTSECVTGVPAPTGAMIDQKIIYRTGSEEVSEALSVDVSVGASYGPVGVNAKTGFAKSLKTTSTSLSMIVYNRVILQTENASNAKFTNLENIQKDDFGSFVSEFGDSFVSSVTTGGEYFAVYTFFSQSREEAKKISASLEVSVGAVASVGTSTAIENAIKTMNVSWELQQHVTGGIFAVPDSDHIVQFSLDFAAKLVDPKNHTVLNFTTTPYENVAGFHALFDDKNAGNLLSSNRYYFDRELFPEIKKINLVNAHVEFILGTYRAQSYMPTDEEDKDMVEVQKQLSVDNDLIRDHLAAYSSSPVEDWAAKSIVSQLTSTSHGYPYLQVTSHSTDVLGGSGGSWFDDSADVKAAPHRAVITYIQAQSASWCNAERLAFLGTIYVFGQDPTEISLTHGDWDGGHNTRVQRVTEGDYIKHVVISYSEDGRAVNFFRVEFNQGNAFEVGNKSTKATMQLDLKPNERVYAFNGRSGVYVDALGVRYFSFEPCNWVADEL
jgi:hypothetical protein